MDYTEIRKLDEETAKDLQESKGPVDECMCNIFSSPTSEPSKTGVKASIKKAFGNISKSKMKHGACSARCPNARLGTAAPGFIRTARRALIWKKGDCGKCGCDEHKIYMKDSDLVVRITAPDINLDAICPCKQNCMPDKAKLKDNIKVTIEHAETPVLESVWSPQSNEFLDKAIKSCIEMRNQVKTADCDNRSVPKIDIAGRLPAIELIKSIHKQPSICETPRYSLARQKLPSVSIESDSINSTVDDLDETSDVVLLFDDIDDHYYEKLFKKNSFSKHILSSVFPNRSRSCTG